MKRIALACALVLAGCGTNQLGAPSAMDTTTAMLDSVDYAFDGNGYGLAAVDEPVTIKSCTASSTRNSYFQASYAIDGNLHSAWAPASDDMAPSLVLTLPTVQRLTRVSLKQSHTNVTVDVAVSRGAGAWTTVATGLAPVATTLSDLDLTACEGDRVKLTFHGQGLADLQVCEVQLGCTASTTPAPQPSAMPLPQPSSVPVPVPVPTPAPVQRPCTVTGGGWLPSPGHDQDRDICFAFVVNVAEPRCTGTIDVDDLTGNGHYHGIVTGAACHGNLVTFTGNLDDQETFTATVVDEGRHGRPDTISFQTSGGVLFCGALQEDAGLRGRIRIGQEVDQQDMQQIGLGVEHGDQEDDYHFRMDDYEKRCREAAKRHGRHGHEGHDD